MKETICWNCQNYSRCCWSRYGKPVKGWTATPTVVKGENYTSFLVEACPHFKPDKKIKVSVTEICEIAGKGARQFYKELKREYYTNIKKRLEEKGYRLHIYNLTDTLYHREYYLEKI